MECGAELHCIVWSANHCREGFRSKSCVERIGLPTNSLSKTLDTRRIDVLKNVRYVSAPENFKQNHRWRRCMKEVVLLIILAIMLSLHRLVIAASFGMIFTAYPVAQSAAMTRVQSTALPMEMLRGRPLSSEFLQNRQTNSPSASLIPELADRDISLLQDLAGSKSTRDFLGISHYRDGRQKLYITSARARIAYKTAEAIESEHKIYPSPSRSPRHGFFTLR